MRLEHHDYIDQVWNYKIVEITRYLVQLYISLNYLNGQLSVVLINLNIQWNRI